MNYIKVHQSIPTFFVSISTNEVSLLLHPGRDVLQRHIPVPEACTIPEVPSSQSLQGRQSGAT